MIIINLLSREKKEELKFRKIYLMGKDFTSIIFIFTILIAIILSGANIILVNTFNDTESNSYFLGTNSLSFKTDLDNLNEQFNNIKDIQSNFIPYDNLLLEITNNIPKNISLSYLSANTNLNKIILKGNALERQDLLNLKRNLEESNIFKNVECPIANLIEKKDINFNITADLNF
ncbi:MAG: PilN domain-containing protein [bacterium]